MKRSKFKKTDIDLYDRQAAFVELKNFCHISKEHDFVEVTEWHNGEGFDITISTTTEQNVSVTYGQFDAIKKLIKTLNSKYL
jgi:hypothetical protein